MSYEIGICRGGGVSGKVRQSTVRSENPLSALYRSPECFSLARPFRIACEGRLALFCGISLWI